VAKSDVSKGRGATLVEDEPVLLRPTTSPRSRIEREFLPDSFSERFPTQPGDFGNDVRVRRRAPVRQGILPAWMKTRWGRIAAFVLLLVWIVAGVAAVVAVRNFFDHDPRFRVDSSDSIQTTGNTQLTREQLLSVFGSDIGRNIFYIPLAERRAQLEQIPWVEHATVMRILPNQLCVAVRERTPVAFVRIGDQIKLIDGAGVILNMPAAMMAERHFSFPVVSGINPSDPPSQRAARMQLYHKFVTALDSTGEHLSSNLSEVNLSDLEDVRVTVPSKSSDLLLHFGDTNFLARYRIYQSHLKEWEQQYPQLASVDLRYDSEVVLKMASGAAAGNTKLLQAPPLSQSASRGANAEAAGPSSVTAAASHVPSAARAKKAATAKHARIRKKHAGRIRR
jgi:cell division protein FtsQ